MWSWKLGHRAVRFIINAASGLINYGCSHNLVYKGEAHCSLWCSCEGLYSPGCITTQASLTFTTAKLTQSHLIIKKGLNLIRERIDGRGRACHGRRHTPKSELNEYSCLHKLCFTSANSSQTFSQNAHEADQKPLSYCSSWQWMVSSPHSHHQPCSLNITICLIVPSKFPFPHPLSLSLHYFLQHHSSFPTVPSVLRILTHMADFDDFTRLRGGPPYLNDLVVS